MDKVDKAIQQAMDRTKDKICVPAEFKERVVDWTKVSDNPTVIEFLKLSENLETKIRSIDENALINYELEVLGLNVKEK